MLYRYSVENFRSFKQRAELVMFPFAAEGIEGKELGDNGTAVSLLQSAVIFGANAAGKSNFVKSIAFARALVLDNSKINTALNPCFKLDDESVYQPTTFNFEFLVNNRLYQYGFSILFSKNKILEEWFYELQSDSQLFMRVLNTETLRYEISYDSDQLDSNEQNRMSVYLEDIQQNYDRLLLSELSSKKPSDTFLWIAIREAFDWLKDLQILFPGSSFNLLAHVAMDETRINEIYKEYFRLFDIHIDSIHLNSVPLEMLHLDTAIIDDMKQKLNEASSDKTALLMANFRGHEYMIDMNAAGDLVAKEVKFRHVKVDGQSTCDFDKSAESDGTKRLFDLIPALARVVTSDHVFIIDEIDRSLHSLLTYHILKVFKNRASHRSQLICTTHEQLLLDSTLFRPDELWLVDLEKNTSQSTLFSLAQYKVRFWENIEKNYLLGRYKGVPQLDTFM